MLDASVPHHEIAHMQSGRNAARRAAQQDAVNAEDAQQQRGGHRRRHLADAGHDEHHLPAVQLPLQEVPAGDGAGR